METQSFRVSHVNATWQRDAVAMAAATSSSLMSRMKHRASAQSDRSGRMRFDRGCPFNTAIDSADT
eukprot:14695-Eustigmatos_ZCMA.PRE.1